MHRRSLLLVSALALLLVVVGCRYDYFFLAFEIECPLDDDGNPTRCWRRGQWNIVRCTRFVSSPFEILAGEYDVEIDIDIPDDAPDGRFPRNLRLELIGYDADMEQVFRHRTDKWRVRGRNGRVEETLEVEEKLMVPPGGELCVNLRTRGPELQHGWLAGILLEEADEEPATASPSSP